MATSKLLQRHTAGGRGGKNFEAQGGKGEEPGHAQMQPALTLLSQPPWPLQPSRRSPSAVSWLNPPSVCLNPTTRSDQET